MPCKWLADPWISPPLLRPHLHGHDALLAAKWWKQVLLAQEVEGIVHQQAAHGS